MTTITPLRAAGATAAVIAVTALILGTGYLWGDRSGGTARTVMIPAALAASSTAAGAAAPSAGITVTGTGTVSGTPDSLQLSMSVSVTQPSVTAALDGANAAAGRVQGVLRQHAVADKDLQTSGLSIQPQYTDVGNRPTINGYQVSESLTATLRDLKSAGSVISAAAQAGGDATRVDSVSLDLSDTGSLLTAARGKAFAQAKDKAQQYAKAAGVRLGDVVSVSEAVNSTSPTFSGDVRAAASGAAQSVPIAAGSQAVGVTVTAVFGIG
jgi:uncharacterized protein